MKSHRVRAVLLATRWTCLTAVGIAIYFGPAVAAADPAMEFTEVTPSSVSRPAPEIAPGGTVVLRGSSSTAQTPNPPALAAAPAATARGKVPVPVVPAAGWDTTGFDRRYNMIGTDFQLDRNYDAGGFDRNFNRNGLSRP